MIRRYRLTIGRRDDTHSIRAVLKALEFIHLAARTMRVEILHVYSDTPKISHLDFSELVVKKVIMELSEFAGSGGINATIPHTCYSTLESQPHTIYV